MAIKKRMIILSAVIGAIIVFSLGSILFSRSASGPGGKTALIYSDGELIRQIDLSASGDQTFEIKSSSGGTNMIEIRDHDIHVSSASCPDGLCMKEGYALSSPVPIVCLPNRLVIMIVNRDNGKEDSYDAVTY